MTAELFKSQAELQAVVGRKFLAQMCSGSAPWADLMSVCSSFTKSKQNKTALVGMTLKVGDDGRNKFGEKLCVCKSIRTLSAENKGSAEELVIHKINPCNCKVTVSSPPGNEFNPLQVKCEIQ